MGIMKEFWRRKKQQEDELAEEQEQWRAKNMQIEKDCGLEKTAASP